MLRLSAFYCIVTCGIDCVLKSGTVKVDLAPTFSSLPILVGSCLYSKLQFLSGLTVPLYISHGIFTNILIRRKSDVINFLLRFGTFQKKHTISVTQSVCLHLITPKYALGVSDKGIPMPKIL